ncbi:hypothetical protein [Corynebacterium sp. 335C]
MDGAGRLRDRTLERHRRACAAAVRGWLHHGAAVPARAVAAALADPAWRAALSGVVVAVHGASGGARDDGTRDDGAFAGDGSAGGPAASAAPGAPVTGILAGADAAGLRLVGPAGERTVAWDDATMVTVPHPALLDDLAAWRRGADPRVRRRRRRHRGRHRESLRHARPARPGDPGRAPRGPRHR